jgi:hypothetical protein
MVNVGQALRLWNLVEGFGLVSVASSTFPPLTNDTIFLAALSPPSPSLCPSLIL